MKFDPYGKDQLQGTKIVSIAQTPDGSIWVLSDVCVSMLNSDKKTFTNYLESASSDITGWLITTLFTFFLQSCRDDNDVSWTTKAPSFKLYDTSYKIRGCIATTRKL